MTIRPQQPPPDAPLHPQSRYRGRPTRMLLLTVGLLVLIGAGGLAWWLFSPLFFHTTSNDANPLTQVPTTASTPAASSTSGTVSTPVSTGPVILATGKFIDKANSGTGL